MASVESVNDVIFVKDLKVSNKVTILDDGEQPIVTVVELADEEESSSDVASAEATPSAA